MEKREKRGRGGPKIYSSKEEQRLALNNRRREKYKKNQEYRKRAKERARSYYLNKSKGGCFQEKDIEKGGSLRFVYGIDKTMRTFDKQEAAEMLSISAANINILISKGFLPKPFFFAKGLKDSEREVYIFDEFKKIYDLFIDHKKNKSCYIRLNHTALKNTMYKSVEGVRKSYGFEGLS